MLGRSQECVISESEIQKNIIKALREHKYVFALCSSTDLDRLATFHAACKKTGRIFLVDEYQNRVVMYSRNMQDANLIYSSLMLSS